MDFGAFYRSVESMGLQRHLKVLGIFARINYRDGKPKYLADTPRFMKYARQTAGRYVECGLHVLTGNARAPFCGRRRPAHAAPHADSAQASH